MIPEELEPKTIKLPDNDSPRILTGNSLRHRRFALRIQQEFTTLVAGWYCFSGDALKQAPKSRKEKIQQLIKDFWVGLKAEIRTSNYFNGMYYPVKFTLRKIRLRRFFATFYRAEQKLFREEVEALSRFRVTEPRTFTKSDLRSDQFMDELKQHNAYFLLTLGGPIYSQDFLKTVSGICLNQHAGHSPEYKGSYTTEWALYHRDIQKISNTVHVTTPGADSGPIVKRSEPCFGPNDKAGEAFCRVVALGTEMLIQTVHEIIQNKTLTVYPQPDSGKTYHSKEFTDEIALAVDQTVETGFIQKSLKQYRNF
jgi:methionyl-tRNA formyltransferase